MSVLMRGSISRIRFCDCRSLQNGSCGCGSQMGCLGRGHRVVCSRGTARMIAAREGRCVTGMAGNRGRGATVCTVGFGETASDCERRSLAVNIGGSGGLAGVSGSLREGGSAVRVCTAKAAVGSVLRYGSRGLVRFGLLAGDSPCYDGGGGRERE